MNMKIVSLVMFIKNCIQLRRPLILISSLGGAFPAELRSHRFHSVSSQYYLAPPSRLRFVHANLTPFPLNRGHPLSEIVANALNHGVF